jgi:abequosyltransferase
LDPTKIEILVVDNASTDSTPRVVQSASEHLVIRYVRHTYNIGSDRNFVFCYHEARGEYLILLSDDDLLGVGAVSFALDLIERERPGVICLRAFGYDADPSSEWPAGGEGALSSLTPDEFLYRAGASITLISSCILRRTDFDPARYVGTNLVQVPMVMNALITGPSFVTQRYWLACKRNNSGGYDFFKVFSVNLSEVLIDFVGQTISSAALKRFKRKLLLQFFPQYIFKALRAGEPSSKIHVSMKTHYGSDLVYRLAYWPLFNLPIFVACVWAGTLAFYGRLLYGDGRRIGSFFLHSMRAIGKGPK